MLAPGTRDARRAEIAETAVAAHEAYALRARLLAEYADPDEVLRILRKTAALILSEVAR